MTLFQSQRLRVLSYNIHHCNPPAVPEHLDVDAIANVIREQKADLVGLQEVDVRTARSKNLDQAQLLAQKTGMEVFFAKAIDFRGGEYGLAILSRWPILATHKYALPSLPGARAEARVLAAIRFQTPDGQEFIFANTHLDSQGENINRLLQIEEIRKISADFALPTILTGDFNAAPGSRPIALLDEFFERAGDETPTIPAAAPLKAIDFIAYRPRERIRVVSHRVIPEQYASDHRPVLSVLQLNAA